MVDVVEMKNVISVRLVCSYHNYTKAQFSAVMSYPDGLKGLKSS